MLPDLYSSMEDICAIDVNKQEKPHENIIIYIFPGTLVSF